MKCGGRHVEFMEFDFKNFQEVRRNRVAERLAEYLASGKPDILWDSMRYSVLGQGKRIRALLCMASAEAVYESCYGQPGSQIIETVLPCCCAIEMLHAMSLIHDDLPCMDNDDLRRGKPTNHKVFGEAIALLAGDALLLFANEILIRKTPNTISPQILLDVSVEFLAAAGAMVGGQVMDLETGGVQSMVSGRTEKDVTLLESVHRNKTGALIRFSLWSGARLAGGEGGLLHNISRFGDTIGLIFQIKDDLLDVTQDKSILGKTPGKDEAMNKLTWVRLFGLSGARKKLHELKREGLYLLDNCGLAQESLSALKELLRYAIEREN